MIIDILDYSVSRGFLRLVKGVILIDSVEECVIELTYVIILSLISYSDIFSLLKLSIVIALSIDLNLWNLFFHGGFMLSLYCFFEEFLME